MSSSTNTTDSPTQRVAEQPEVGREHRVVTEQPAEIETRPTLDSVVRAICFDAKQDSLQFILRSDTGHDGE